MNADEPLHNSLESAKDTPNDFENLNSINEAMMEAELLHDLLTNKRLPENNEESLSLEYISKIEDFQNAYAFIPDNKPITSNATTSPQKTFLRFAVAATIALLLIGVASVFYFKNENKNTLIAKKQKIEQSKNPDTGKAILEKNITFNSQQNNPSVTSNVSRTYTTIQFLEQELALGNETRSSGFKVIHKQDMPPSLQYGQPFSVSVLIYENQLGHDVLLEDELKIELWYADNSKQPIFGEILNIKGGIFKKDFTSIINQKGNYYFRIIHDADVILLHKVLVD